MSHWQADRWVLRDPEGVMQVWLANVAGRYLLGVVGGPQAWYDSLSQAMTAGEAHVRNEAKLRGAL